MLDKYDFQCYVSSIINYPVTIIYFKIVRNQKKSLPLRDEKQRKRSKDNNKRLNNENK